MRFRHGACIAVLLASCAAPPSYEAIGSRPADQNYRRLDAEFAISRGGNATVRIFIKAFDSDGRLGLCGYYTAEGGKMAQGLVQASIQDPGSELYLDGRKVGNMTFVYANERGFDDLDATAYCVRTKEAWTETFATGRIAFTTPAVRGDF